MHYHNYLEDTSGKDVYRMSHEPPSSLGTALIRP
jgi:hypothetical protein